MKRNVIEELKSVRGLQLECPRCGEAFPLRRATVFDMRGDYPAAARRDLSQRAASAADTAADAAALRAEVRERRRRAPERIQVATYSTNVGQIGEQIVPSLAGFPYRHAECRFMAKPIDYLVFHGLTTPRGLQEIRFVDVKTGHAALSRDQRAIRAVVQAGAVTHRVLGDER